MQSDSPLWTPGPDNIKSAHLTAFTEKIKTLTGTPVDNYKGLHQWSIDHPELFWQSVWDFCDLIGDPGERVLVNPGKMPGATWFPDARLNYAENILRYTGSEPALIFWGEDKVKRTLSRDELISQVAGFAAALKNAGVEEGDRVAAFMPNMPETIIAALAAASIGAIFTSASPDFGIQGVLDRFDQTSPKVLISVDGYYYNGRPIETFDKVVEISNHVASIEQVVIVKYLEQAVDLGSFSSSRASIYGDFLSAEQCLPDYKKLPFNHPLFIMYSSGTTGLPKCIVHGAGGTLLEHVKEMALHADVHEGDRLFYFTTCGWMMWNWMLSGLAAGACLMLYDGNPFIRNGRVLWEFCEQERITHFGTSAKYLGELAKRGFSPGRQMDLSSLRAIFSTGGPLVPEMFDYVYASIKADVQLASISGGTDIISCFVMGNPCLPVWRGEIQSIGLGMAVAVYDEEGNPLDKGEKGELVCTRPFPCAPVGFWNDPDNKKYHAAYFERFPGVWHHGDYCEITEHDGVIIHGRSDATLNPGGVRIGTSEIYRLVETLPEVLESIVIGQSWPPSTRDDVRIVLFVKLQEGLELDADLENRLKQTIRANASPRHVPAKILQVADIPKTRNGKLVELAVKNVIEGRAVKNSEALMNPESLEYFSQHLPNLDT